MRQRKAAMAAGRPARLLPSAARGTYASRMRIRHLLAVAALAFAVTACSSGSSSDGSSPTAGGNTPPPGSPGGTVNVSLKNLTYNPSSISGSVSGTMVVKNEDTTLHNVTIEGTPVDQDVQPGQTFTFTPPAPFDPGTYNVFCKYHKSQGMVAVLTVGP
jgi:plastocyanin